MSYRLLGLLLLFWSPLPLFSSQVQIHIAATSDLHGWVSTQSMYPQHPRGLAHVVPIIQQLRKQSPELILLDAGDTLQGSPSAYYFLAETMGMPPILKLMNELLYDAVVLGNHDLEVAPNRLSEALKHSKFSWLAANVQQKPTQLPLKPYHLITVQGVRVAILGIITPGTPMWVDPENLQYLTFEDGLSATKKWVTHLKSEQQADVVIVLIHAGSGFQYDLDKALGNQVWLPNVAGVIADEVSQVDLIISGHAHQTAPIRKTSLFKKHPTPLVSAGSWGAGVQSIQMSLQSKGNQWHVTHVQAEFLKAAVQPDEIVMQTLQKDLGAVESYLNEKTMFEITQVPDELVFEQCSVELSHHIFQHKVLLSPWKWKFESTLTLPHRIARRDLFRWMPYDNRLVTAKLYGKQVLNALGVYLSQSTSAFLYNARLFPGGFQVSDLGQEWPLDQIKIVGMGNYHWNGGGGIRSKALFQNRQKQHLDSVSIRNRVFEALQQSQPLPEVCLSFIQPL